VCRREREEEKYPSDGLLWTPRSVLYRKWERRTLCVRGARVVFFGKLPPRAAVGGMQRWVYNTMG